LLYRVHSVTEVRPLSIILHLLFAVHSNKNICCSSGVGIQQEVSTSEICFESFKSKTIFELFQEF